MSLRLLVNLLITAVSLIFLAGLAYVLVDGYRASVREEVTAATRVTVQMMQAVVAENLQAGATPQAAEANLVAFVRRLGRVRSNDIVVYQAAEVIYSSPPPTYKAGRFAPDWFAALVTPDLKLTEIRLPGMRLMIVPDASRAVLDAWDDGLRIFWLALGFFAVLNALVFAFVGRALRPLEEIVGALRAMQQGSLQARLPRFRIPELASVSDSFNRMAEQLESTLSINRRLEQKGEVARLLHRHIEEERRGIARELHDELGQALTAIRTIAVSIANRTRQGQPEIHENANTIAAVAGQVYDGVHGIVHRLRPAALENLGLPQVLQDLAGRWRPAHPDVELSLEVGEGLEDADEGVVLAAFRVVQECLTNVARHSGATRVDVSAHPATGSRDSAPAVQIVVKDNGKGLASAAPPGRFGVMGMRERVEALGGWLTLESGPGAGVTVSVVLPLKD